MMADEYLTNARELVNEWNMDNRATMLESEIEDLAHRIADALRAEREACAKVAEGDSKKPNSDWPDVYATRADIAAAIRARSTELPHSGHTENCDCGRG